MSDHELSLPDWYAAVIKKDLAQISALTSYLVADAYFSKKGFVDKIMDMNLYLVCKLRDDADLLYLSKQAPIDVIDIYHTRFQMEFGFRDAKQFAGLEHSQARSVNKLDFHFNTALTTVNIAKVIQLKDETKRELPFSMRDAKVLFHNALLLQRFFAMFGNPPNSRKNQKYFNELLIFGTLAA